MKCYDFRKLNTNSVAWHDTTCKQHANTQNASLNLLEK